MKKTKYLFFTIIMMGLFMINTRALVYEEVDSNKVVPSDYAFTPKFIQGENGTNIIREYGDSTNCDSSCIVANNYKINPNDDYTKIYIIYENVGNYFGRQVDLKISFLEIDFGGNEFVEYNFAATQIGISLYRANSAKFNFEYLDHETKENMNIKSLISYNDIDGTSKYDALNNGKIGEIIGIDRNKAAFAYVSHYGFERFDVEDTDDFKILKGTYKWTGICGSHDGESDCRGYGGDEVFEGGYDGDGNLLTADQAVSIADDIYNAGIVTALYHSAPFTVLWKSYYLGISNAGFLDIQEPSPSLYLYNESSISDKILFEILQIVPNIDKKWYYKSWSLETDLTDKLNVDLNDVIIHNNGGEDVTNLFDISVVDNKLIINAKEETLNSPDFYNNIYGVIIFASPTENAQVGDVITSKTVHLTTSAGGENRRLESDEATIKILDNNISNVIIEDINGDNNIDDSADNSSVLVPSTKATISVFLYILGFVIAALGIFMYFRVSKQLQKQNEDN